MQEVKTKSEWESYCMIEMGVLEPILNDLGFFIDQDQQHIKGERFLMQAVTTKSGKKLILTGHDAHNNRVIVKATRDDAGKKEIEHERLCRSILGKINFAAEVFHSPAELLYTESHGFLISVQEFIAQDTPFLERSLEEQCMLALGAFRAQEGAHATTHKHLKTIGKAFEIRTVGSYLKNFTHFHNEVQTILPEEQALISLLASVKRELTEEQETIEQYCGFLTHTDFVPHNFRIKNNVIYLLDHSSLAFGNKFEGWARFLNFMVLYNQPLQEALEQYVQDNRAEEEQQSLYLMRLYRLGEIICYYTGTLERSEGSLHELNKSRVYFWKKVLEHTQKEESVPTETILAYQNLRDGLRSSDEKARQKNLH